MSENKKNLVSIDDFTKIDIRIGKIISVEEIPNSNKLFKLIIDIKEKKIQCVAGLRDYYKSNELKNKLVAVIVNLRPAKLRGVVSEGMILAAEDDQTVRILSPESEVKIGAKVR
ncbi:MAG: methionine--tRNA ligase subunit beta [Candidatus Helarchaeota archaeon]